MLNVSLLIAYLRLSHVDTYDVRVVCVCVCREKSKKWSKQMAALVCLQVLGEDFTAVNHHTSSSTSSSSSSRWSAVSQLTVECDHSSSTSWTASSTTANLPHKRLKLSPPTDSPSANHMIADVNLSSAVEIVQQDLSQTVDTEYS